MQLMMLLGLSSLRTKKVTTSWGVADGWSLSNNSRSPLASIRGSQGSALPGGQSRAIASLTSTKREMFSARST